MQVLQISKAETKFLMGIDADNDSNSIKTNSIGESMSANMAVLRQPVDPNNHLQYSICFNDAAFPANPPANYPIKSGLGASIICRYQENNFSIHVQAKARHAASVLDAEAQAMNMASKIIKALNLNDILIVSDNQTLTTTLSEDNLTTNPGDWRIRPTLVDLQNNLQFRN